jgi:hypothetical protein
VIVAALLRTLLVFALCALPALAHACPACVGQQDRWNFALKALGVMILFPFLVAFLVIRAIRRAHRDE